MQYYDDDRDVMIGISLRPEHECVYVSVNKIKTHARVIYFYNQLCHSHVLPFSYSSYNNYRTRR